MDALSWEVVLPNGTTVREPPENASIRTAPRGATHLRVVDPTGKIVRALALEGTRPIFYRRRYQDAGAPPGSSKVGATVFGWGRESDNAVEGFVWAATGGRIVECPAALRDQAMIERQVTG